jgi:membrane-associated phospholipid phosphatase
MPIKHKIKYILFILISILSNILIENIKTIKYGNNNNSIYNKSKLYNITRRPNGAKNCDLLSRNGIRPNDEGGFPSGHMNSAVFYSLFMISQGNTSNAEKLFYILIPIIMGCVRYYKKCHNLLQIIAGAVFGWLSMMCYTIIKNSKAFVL